GYVPAVEALPPGLRRGQETRFQEVRLAGRGDEDGVSRPLDAYGVAAVNQRGTLLQRTDGPRLFERHRVEEDASHDLVEVGGRTDVADQRLGKIGGHRDPPTRRHPD